MFLGCRRSRDRGNVLSFSYKKDGFIPTRPLGFLRGRVAASVFFLAEVVMGNLKKLVKEEKMLKVIKFYFNDSKYSLFRRFGLGFEFRAKSSEPGLFMEEIFFRVEPFIYPYELSYYNTRLIVFPFKIINNNSEVYLTFEFYEMLTPGHIVNVLEYDNFVVTVTKDHRYSCWFGGGEFKIFPTLEEMEHYYDRYRYNELDEDELDEDSYCECGEELEELEED
jgi:hypothetical protein